MRFSTAVYIAVLVSNVLALPSFSKEDISPIPFPPCNDNQTARLFEIPPVPTDTSSKQIPPPDDMDHRFIAPGPGDTRGPCPMLNTLANHGYINRTGIDTTENIMLAVMEGGNMEHDFAAFVVSFATLARGNANTATLSIGFQSHQVPPLPGCIDGFFAGGLAKHGRFEGDVSSTRSDHGVGDSVNFNSTIYDELLSYVNKYGDDDPEGNKTVVNVRTFQDFKYNRFLEDQQEDKQLQFHIGRQLTTYAEVAFILELFQDGRSNQTSVKQMSSFFVNQTFGDNFWRRQGPAGAAIIGATAAAVRDASPIPPGANDADGTYVIDTPSFTDFTCDGYYDLATNNLAASLYNASATTTTSNPSIFQQNVATMLDAMFKPFRDTASCTKQGFPSGPTAV